ncbi:hypothetical protein [Heyndrickxia coagulans]|uniref:hypothetical protein n=1 Tax=Heyndrickxia coagulans TaxID=1398 RepID=UPI0003612592|nr:hypothetical protein [Heyndrickxia coagulans]
MRIIMTSKSLGEVKVLPPSYINYMEQEWRTLYESFETDVPIDAISLKEHGCMVCIEAGDKPLFRNNNAE